MNEYYVIITPKGEEEILNALTSNTIFKPSYIAVGDSNGNYYEPEYSQTSLKNETYRGEIYSQGKYFKNNENDINYLYFDMQIPPSIGDFVVREAGLFNSDNELLAIAKYPELNKLQSDSWMDRTVSIEIQICLSDEAINTIIIDDSGNLATNEKITEAKNEIVTYVNEKTDEIISNLPSSYKPRQLLTFITPVEDSGLHLANGSLLQYGSYKAFIDDTAEYVNKNTLYAYIYNDGTDDYIIYTKTTTIVSDTILYNNDGTVYTGNDFVIVDNSGYEIQYNGNTCVYTSTNNILPYEFTTEANWQSDVTQYGVCGKFVYDSINNTVRLPKITGFIEGTLDITALGDIIKAGLPNITGDFSLGGQSGCLPISTYSSANGAFSLKSNTSKVIYNANSSSTNTALSGVNYDASNSNSIYGNSSTVQPQAIKVFYYIVIATTTKTDIQVNIDEIATDLNGKMDIDGTNAAISVKNFDGQWIDISGDLPYLQITAPTEVTSFDISDYLPNDNFNYEILVSVIARTGTTSGNMNNCLVSSSIINGIQMAHITTRTANWDQAASSTILPIGIDRTFIVSGFENNTGRDTFFFRAYRRLGTNQ